MFGSRIEIWGAAAPLPQPKTTTGCGVRLGGQLERGRVQRFLAGAEGRVRGRGQGAEAETVLNGFK